MNNKPGIENVNSNSKNNNEKSAQNKNCAPGTLSQNNQQCASINNNCGSENEIIRSQNQQHSGLGSTREDNRNSSMHTGDYERHSQPASSSPHNESNSRLSNGQRDESINSNLNKFDKDRS